MATRPRRRPTWVRRFLQSATRERPTLLIPVVVSFSVLMTSGCASAPPPDTQSEAAAGEAAGLADAVVFRVDGGPDDEPDAPSELTLPEAVRLAVTTDPGVQASLARVRVALADAKQTRLLPNPILSLAFRVPEGGGKPLIEAALAQDIIAILTIPGRSRASDNRLRQASAEVITTTIDLVAEVQERYATAQALEQLLLVLDQRASILSKVVELAKARLAAGEGIRGDVTTLETQRIELDVEIAERTQELRDERLRLARLIGRPSAGADWRLEPWTPPTLTDVPESVWIDAGLRCRPEIQECVWLLAALGDELGLARMLAFDGASGGVQAQRDGGWQAGPELSVPVPIFDSGGVRAERVSAEQIEARHELVRAKRHVIEDVRRALESLARTRDNARRVRMELIPLQEKRRAQAEASFSAGQSDATALLLAEQDLHAAQAKAVELDQRAALAAIRLQRAVGGPGPASRVNASGPSEGGVK
ncbi:MAG: TolC family protein [Phycisphaerales bacterium]